jgi:cytochrome c553
MKTQLALFFAATLSVPAVAADAPSKGDPKAAEAIVTQVCAACHGADGNSASPANPSLAGQGAEYLNKQLVNFKSGERKSPVMAGMVASLSPADMKNLAAFFSENRPSRALPKTGKRHSWVRRSIAAACKDPAYRLAPPATAPMARAFPSSSPVLQASMPATRWIS